MAMVAAACGLAACSAGARSSDGKWGPPPEAMTRAMLVGELCEHGTPCACRDEGAPGLGGVSAPGAVAPVDEEGDGGAAALLEGQPAPELDDGERKKPAPPPEVKRVELRLRSSHELWLRVGEQTFVKDRERAEACFYIDLPSPGIGERPKPLDVELRASNADGVSAGLAINEMGVEARSWYRTFDFTCGVPGACSFEELDELKESSRRAVADHTLYDPCGSIRVRNLHWDSRVAPDHEYPGDLTLHLALEVLGGAPERPRGDPNCSLR
jgi:hypothetical protein